MNQAITFLLLACYLIACSHNNSGQAYRSVFLDKTFRVSLTDVDKPTDSSRTKVIFGNDIIGRFVVVTNKDLSVSPFTWLIVKDSLIIHGGEGGFIKYQIREESDGILLTSGPGQVLLLSEEN